MIQQENSNWKTVKKTEIKVLQYYSSDTLFSSWRVVELIGYLDRGITPVEHDIMARRPSNL